MAFKSNFVGTYLLIWYDKNRAQIKSDSLTTMVILKDVMLKQASLRKLQIDFESNMKEETALTVLNLLKPKVEYFQELQKKF